MVVVRDELVQLAFEVTVSLCREQKEVNDFGLLSLGCALDDVRKGNELDVAVSATDTEDSTGETRLLPGFEDPAFDSQALLVELWTDIVLVEDFCVL